MSTIFDSYVTWQAITFLLGLIDYALEYTIDTRIKVKYFMVRQCHNKLDIIAI